MERELPDAELVMAARAGSQPALEGLVRRYQRPIYRLCHGYVRDHDAASDLCQRAFLRALCRMGELRDAQQFRGWLFRIAENLARNQLRDEARFVRTPGPEGWVPAGAQAALEAAEQLERLRHAIARLPGRQRAVVRMRLERELTFGQIGRLLDITENAAKVTFHHAGKGLRRLLDPGR